jgi:hypothetical protein
MLAVGAHLDRHRPRALGADVHERQPHLVRVEALDERRG